MYTNKLLTNGDANVQIAQMKAKRRFLWIKYCLGIAINKYINQRFEHVVLIQKNEGKNDAIDSQIFYIALPST